VSQGAREPILDFDVSLIVDGAFRLIMDIGRVSLRERDRACKDNRLGAHNLLAVLPVGESDGRLLLSGM
jgi:hypothetical protein